MRNLRRITVIMVMVCLMIGQSGCAGIFDSTKSEVRIAKKVLKEKYNEDFEIISLGGRGGTLTRYKKRGIFIRLLEEIQQLGMRVSII